MPGKKLIPVLAGGGTRLPAHVGILTALEQMDFAIDRLVGVSGGSILAEDALYHPWTDDDTPVVYFRLRAAREARPQRESTIFPLADYLTMLIRTFMTSISREYVSDPYWRNTVVVDTGATSPIEFAMTPEQKEDLFRRGLETAHSVIPMKLGRPSPDPAPGTC